MPEWKIRRGDQEFIAKSTDELRRWYTERRIQPSDYVWNPMLEKWLYPKDLEELRVIGAAQIVEPARANPSAEKINRISIGVGVLGILLCFFSPLLGILLIACGLVLSVAYYVMR